MGSILMHVVGSEKQYLFSTFSLFISPLDSHANYCHSLLPANDTSIIHLSSHADVLISVEMHLVFISRYPLSDIFVAELVQTRTEQSWHITE